jgi:beta-phosphoglucomutase-like phosphatase (HAD superfamily)
VAEFWNRRVLGLPDGIRGCLFGLDGVLTRTAKVHAAAWKEIFDSYPRDRARQTGQPFVPFDPVRTTTEYVDGKPRGRARSWRPAASSCRRAVSPILAARRPSTACKNTIVLRRIRVDGVEVYAGSAGYVRVVREAGLRRAVVSSCANCRKVLVAAGIED